MTQNPMIATAHPSADIRAAIAVLDDSATAAQARLETAEAEHARALRASVIAPHTTDNLHFAEAELADARATNDRTFASLATARSMLSEALAAELRAKQDAARERVEDQLTEIAAAAVAADAAFADLVQRLHRLRELELAARATVRAGFGVAPAGAPQTLTAARPMATNLVNIANGLASPSQPWIADTLAKAAHVIRDGCQP